MSEPKFTLSWQGYQKNLCKELGSFQQNEDFVDMTLAADGHFVKVHQIIISLVSPYLKEIIKSAQCQHPVIFLNKMSHQTLSSLLEYIYTGEVTVAKENFEEFTEAGKDLRIRGLDSVGTPNLNNSSTVRQENPSEPNTTLDENNHYLDSPQSNHEIYLHDDIDNTLMNVDEMHDDPITDDTKHSHDTGKTSIQLSSWTVKKKDAKDVTALSDQLPTNPNIQYTVSNQGNLQMILNRFMYYLRYKRKDNSVDSRRMWRCVDYIKLKCPASVITKGSIVVARTSAHTHPFHDKRIAKKVSRNAVFSAIMEAEQKGDTLKLKNKD